MDHRSPKKNFRHCLPMTFTMDDNEWVNSEKEACSASFSYWAATGKSTGWNWPLGWKRSNEENRHLPTSFLGLFYPTLKKKLKSETMILGGGPCSQSVRRITSWNHPVIRLWWWSWWVQKSKSSPFLICHLSLQLIQITREANFCALERRNRYVCT